MDKKFVINEILEGCRAVRRLRPLVHMIPNYVTAGICADAIAAVGGRPLMASAPEEMEEITASADGLVVNLGQPSEEKFRACATAMETAAKHSVPVLFDPVGAGASKYRRDMTGCLTELPWSGVIKGNSSEIRTVLTGILSHDGVDSLKEFENTAESPAFFKRMKKKERYLVLASTGAPDRIFWSRENSGRIPELILNHQADRPVVMVGTGCIAGALGGTLLAAAGMERKKSSGRSGWDGSEQTAVLTAAAVALTAFAGEEAGSGKAGGDFPGHFGPGYGTYQTGLLDCLSTLNEERFAGYLERNLELKEE